MKTGIRKLAERTAAVTLAGVLAAGMLTGCADKKLDGSSIVATVNGSDITMGLLSLYVRQQQAYTESMYASIYASMGNTASVAIWDTVMDEESDKTYGEQVVEDSLEQIELMYLMKEKAPDYGVEVTAEDQTAIEEAAKAFMAANTEETLEDLAVSEEDVKMLLELRTYSERIHDPIIADVDREVSDEEAQQSRFSYVSLDAMGTDLTAEEITTTKANAQAILDKMKEDPSADMDAVAKEVDETLSASEGTFTANVPEGEEDEEEEETSSYPDEVITALRELKEGEVADEVIETDDSYYIVRLDAEFDEDATESRKESIISERESQFYEETTDQWLEDADIQVKDKVLKTLKVTDTHKYNLITPEDETADEDALTEDEIDEEALEGDEAAEETDTADETTAEETDAVDETTAEGTDAADETTAEETDAADETSAEGTDAADETAAGETDAADETTAEETDTADETSAEETNAADESSAEGEDAEK